MVLGDAPFFLFLCDEEHEQLQINLLTEFEAVADEAGRLVHSLIFSTPKDTVLGKNDERFDVPIEHMDLLKGNIRKFSNLLPLITKPNTTSKTSSLYIIDSLIYDLGNLLSRDDRWSIDDVKDQIKELHQELITSQSLLKGIKLPPPQSEIQELKEHVIRITDVAFEAEYLINSFLARDALLWYFSIRLSHVLHKIKLIGTAFQELKNNYEFGALKLANNFSSQLPLRAKRNSEVDDIVIGFKGRWVTDILEKLVRGTEQLQVISIFGMPGLGKTTFAKKLYNDPTVNYRFDKRSWCVVSQTYQRKSLLADVLISLDKDKIWNMEEECLAEDIYKSLKGRRYLIVMDDVWDSKAWGDLRRFFPNDGNGSRILFTTRHKDVAPPNSIICELPYLSNDQCWELLEKKLFNNKPWPSQLLGIGKEIAANCHGLPLAVVVIAGILSNMDQEESAWKEVGENISSYISSGGNNSPAHKLMRLWVAEGFIPEGDKKTSESLAEQFLMKLIDRSLVTVAKRRSDG